MRGVLEDVGDVGKEHPSLCLVFIKQAEIFP
jgi:hypothetical protein